MGRSTDQLARLYLIAGLANACLRNLSARLPVNGACARSSGTSVPGLLCNGIPARLGGFIQHLIIYDQHTCCG